MMSHVKLLMVINVAQKGVYIRDMTLQDYDYKLQPL